MDELRALDLPGKAVVLIESVVGRVDDLIALFMLHEHPAVVIVDSDDALLDPTAALRRAVNGEVAALGMSADADGPIAILPRDARDIFDRLLLRRDFL